MRIVEVIKEYLEVTGHLPPADSAVAASNLANAESHDEVAGGISHKGTQLINEAAEIENKNFRK